MSYEWLLEIEGEINVLEKLVNTDFKGIFLFLNLDEHFFIKSNEFDNCENLEDVLKKGEEIVKLINGVAEINPNLDNKKIRILGVREKNENKNYRQECLEASLIVQTDLNSVQNLNNSILNWVELSEKCENVKAVFKLLNYKLNSYVNMYRIYEIIKNDLGKNYLDILKIQPSDIDRFTASANRPDISGELARHGYLKGEPPKKNPMNINQAYNFIYNMIYNWIHYKLKSG